MSEIRFHLNEKIMYNDTASIYIKCRILDIYSCPHYENYGKGHNIYTYKLKFENGKIAETVESGRFRKMLEFSKFKVGDIVPYKNTRGNIRETKITEFKELSDGNVWFYGNDTVTGSITYYPVHLSLSYR